MPPTSRVGSHTSCYSLLDGTDLFVLDAGRGLGALSRAVIEQDRFRRVERVHVLLSHSHMDHWEGLKDSDWFWRGGSGNFELKIYGTNETLRTIDAGYAHPAYVGLQQLAAVSGQQLAFDLIATGDVLELGRARVTSYPLNHFSGWEHDPSHLETTGYLIELPNGASVAYFSDHMPASSTVEIEQRILGAARLALFDAHYATIAEQNFGHGSQERAAKFAAAHPSVMIVAGHHGSSTPDDDIFATHRRFSDGLPNLWLAIEGESYLWTGERFQNSSRASAMTATTA